MIKQKVVAAIDFGTYGSGYAWAAISEQNKDPGSRQIKVRNSGHLSQCLRRRT